MGDTAFIRTTTLPTGLRIAHVVGLTSAAFLAGKTFSQTFSAVPALLHAPAPLLAQEWKTMFDSDRYLAPVIVAYGSGLFGWLAWRDHTSSPTPTSTFYNTAATALLLLTIPYSLLFLEPVTEQLENKARELYLDSAETGVERERTTHWLVDRWATINLGRAVIAGVAAVAGTWAALGGVRVGGIGVVSGATRMGR